MEEAATPSRVSSPPDPTSSTEPLLVQIPRMGISELIDLLTNESLDPGSEEFQLVEKRHRYLKLVAEIRGTKRSLEDTSVEHASESKRHRTEFKYTNINKITPTASLRKFADWKADMTRLSEGSPAKFTTDSIKLIAAHQYMDEKAKTLWQTHIHITFGDETWPKFLQWAQRMVSRGANSQVTIYQDYHDALQEENQSPMVFDAYLNSLESVMGEQSQVASAMGFFTRLTKPLRAKMEMSGRECFPETRQEMVAFAQRVWHGMKQTGEAKPRKEKDTTNQDTSTTPTYRPRGGRGGYGRSRGRGGRTGPPGSREGMEERGNKFPTGLNEKGEACCYKCGSTSHFATICDNSGPTEKTGPKKDSKEPKVNQLKETRSFEDVTSSDSEN